MSCKMSELNEKIGVNDRVRFYDENQEGGRAGAVIWNGFLVWENGSSREFGGGGYGLMLDSTWVDENDSQQVRELLHWQKRFCEQKLEDAVKLFEAAKLELENRARHASQSGSVPPNQSEVRDLKRLKRKVDKWTDKYNLIFEELNPQPAPIVYTKEDVKIMNENRLESERILQALGNLEV